MMPLPTVPYLSSKPLCQLLLQVNVADSCLQVLAEYRYCLNNNTYFYIIVYDVNKKVKQEDGSIKNVKTEEIYEYHIGIVNRDEEDEEVTYIERQEVKDEEGNVIIKGFKMALEGFFTGI